MPPHAPPSPSSRLSWLKVRTELWLSAIREAYVALLPLTILGALAVTAAQNPYPPYILWMTQTFGADWQMQGMRLFNATMGMMGLAGAAAICFNVSARIQSGTNRSYQTMIAIPAVAGSAFFLIVMSTEVPDFKSLGYASAFQSIIVGIASAELMHFFGHRLPQSKQLAPIEGRTSLHSALRLSVTATLALTSILLGYWLLKSCLAHLTEPLLPPLSAWLTAHNPGADVLNASIVVINQLLWTLGINGGQFLLHLGASDSGLIGSGSVLYAANAASPMFVNAFAHLGGAGATWGLIIYCIVWGKDRSLKRLAWYSVLPAILNVNELLLFGIPLVLSRTLVIPFIAAPLFNCLMATLAIHTLGMTLDGQAVAWSTPIVVSGYLMSSSWLGAAVQLVCLAASTLIYAPFVRQLEHERHQHSKDLLSSVLKLLSVNDVTVGSKILKRTDAVGDVARHLIHNFRADLGTERVRLFYQPQHDRHGHTVGVEALLRWTHATYGPIPPQAIVNIAEECDLIHTLGEWVVNQVCADTARWQAAGYEGITVSLNMSPVQLESSSWVEVVQAAIEKHRIPVQNLDIEITEGKAMSLSEQANRTLRELQELRVHLSMDDFGMGCTSLLYMQRFKMYALKLDGVLTRDVQNNTVNQEVIRCICVLGHTQGVRIVAEYVETEAQKEMLEMLGCDHFQGWLYCPAIPEAQLLPYLDRTLLHSTAGMGA